MNPELNRSSELVPRDAILVEGLSNRDFLERYAQAGRVGLSAGTALADRMIARAERHIDERGQWGSWSHAFVFEGRRVDGHHWLMESDLQFHRKHVQLGVQENRLAKYFDEELYTALAVLDFGLTADQVAVLINGGLELVATHTRYSLRELLGTLVALRQPKRRGQENLLARDHSFYCSAFVQHLFRHAGLDLAPGLEVKNTTPEDLARSPVPHASWLLRREMPRSPLAAVATRVRRRVQRTSARRAR